MTDHLALLRKKLDHLARMREYLLYSLEQVQTIVAVNGWEQLGPEQHESLAAYLAQRRQSRIRGRPSSASNLFLMHA